VLACFNKEAPHHIMRNENKGPASVAIKHIVKTECIKDKALPIGDTYKKHFFEKIESYKL
jgi:hypothetical protein